MQGKFDENMKNTANTVDAKPDCESCIRPMNGHKTDRICRWYGLPISHALEADCKQYVPKTAEITAREWACIVDWMGRGG